MFLHIGNSKIIFNQDLIGIFNVDSTDENVNRHFYKNASYDALSILYGHDQPKSYIVTRSKVYMSPISPLTLSRRHKYSR